MPPSMAIPLHMYDRGAFRVFFLHTFSSVCLFVVNVVLHVAFLSFNKLPLRALVVLFLLDLLYVLRV